jgi:hypothetical protein
MVLIRPLRLCPAKRTSNKQEAGRNPINVQRIE